MKQFLLYVSLLCKTTGLMQHCNTIYRNKPSLSFSDRSIYDLMVEEILLLIAKLQSISTSNFDVQMSEILVILCLCPTYSVNDLVIFTLLLRAKCCGCFCGWITKRKWSISLPGRKSLNMLYL